MTEPTSSSDSFRATARDCAGLGDKLKKLVHEGNVRRVIVAHDGRTVAEFPLTAGAIGVVLAPAVAAIGALVALLKRLHDPGGADLPPPRRQCRRYPRHRTASP